MIFIYALPFVRAHSDQQHASADVPAFATIAQSPNFDARRSLTCCWSRTQRCHRRLSAASRRTTLRLTSNLSKT